MTVQRKPKTHQNDIGRDKASEFVDGALSPTFARSKKVPVALRFDSDLLRAIDKMAVRRGMSRNAIISYWCSKAVENE